MLRAFLSRAEHQPVSSGFEGAARGGTFPVKVPVPPTKTARKVDAAPERVNKSGDETRVSAQRARVSAQRAQVSRSEPKASEDHEVGERSPSGGSGDPAVEPRRTFFLKSDFIFDYNAGS